MRLLDRYIFRQVLLTCVGAVTFFTFIVLAANALKDLLGHFLAGQLPPEAGLQLLTLLVPYSATYALPMGILCGVLLVLGRLSADSEIVALRAAGLSLWRISLPIHLFAVVCVAVGLYVNFEYMPRARTAYTVQLTDTLRTQVHHRVQPRTFVREFKNTIFYVSDKQGNELRDLWIWRLDPERRVVSFIRAEAGEVQVADDGENLVLRVTNVTVEHRKRSDPEDVTEPPATATFESTMIPLSIDQLLGKKNYRRKLDWLTYGQLRDELKRLGEPVPPEAEEERARDRVKVQMVIQEKGAMAFAIWAFALVAIPLGIKTSRRETSANFGIAVVLALSYYFLIVAMKWLDQHPEWHPHWLLWLPNAIFLGLGVWLSRRVGRV